MFPCAAYTVTLAKSATTGTLINARPKRPASAPQRATYRVSAASKGPPTSAFSHSETGTVGRFHVGMVSTEYATDTMATNTAPVTTIKTSTARCNQATGFAENEYSQYRPQHARNATALLTSFDSGLDPTCMNTYSALAGLPRCVADAISPTMVTTSGMHMNLLMRARTSSPSFANSSTAATMASATAPDGASVVNNTSVTSPNAVSNPEIISFPHGGQHPAARPHTQTGWPNTRPTNLHSNGYR